MLTRTQRNRLTCGLFLLFFLSNLSLKAQFVRKGQVIDAETREPLAFAHIIFDISTRQGTLADIDGNFVLKSPSQPDAIVVSYLGYKTLTYSLLNDESKIIIALKPTGLSLSEVLIEAERNPAETLIKKVIANKKRNNPDRIVAYTCETYNKAVYDWFLRSDTTLNLNQAEVDLQKFISKTALLVMESVTERKFTRPDRLEEVVVGTRVSGFKRPDFAPLSTDIQPFAFYQEVVTLLDRAFINPIANGSLRRYDYRLIDTIFQELDTIYVVSFKPQEGKNFEALEGQLYINTHHYALQNVIAHPAEQGLMEFQIEQKYILIDDKQWFPHQLNFEILAGQLPSDEVGMRITGKSYIRKVDLEPGLTKKSFGYQQTRMEKDAHEKDSTYWTQQREDSLNLREENTYVMMDSLGEKINMDGLLRIGSKLGEGKLPIGPLDLDFNKVYTFNEYEGHRLGLGLLTNERISEYITLGGYFGYGTRDKGWKYGGSLDISLLPRHEWKIGGQYKNDVREPGQSSLTPVEGYNYVRNLLISRMDRGEEMSVYSSWRMLKYAQLKVVGSQYEREPLYPYQFESWQGDSLVRSTDIQVRLRYAFKEKIVESFGQNYQMGSKYPVIEVNYTRGLEDVLDGELSYSKWEIDLTQTWSSKAFGESQLRIRGGMVDGNLPSNWLFYGAGVKHPEIWLLVPHSFQTMQPYEFLSDQYVYGFFTQDIGSRLFNKGKFRPKVELIQAVAWGKLGRPEVHQGFPIKTLEKGYFESGVMIRQLLKFKYLNIAYIGLGGGVFYRYGPYHLPELGDNFAIKIALSVSTF